MYGWRRYADGLDVRMDSMCEEINVCLSRCIDGNDVQWPTCAVRASMHWDWSGRVDDASCSSRCVCELCL